MFSIKSTQDKVFLILFLIVSIAVLVITGMRSYLLPITHDETATFYYYIQSGQFLPFLSHPDANNHFLNSFLSWISFNLFGDSPFSLRLPNLFGLTVLFIATWRISNHLNNTFSKIILLCGMMISFHWLSFYSVTRGYGISVSLLLLGISYLLDYFKNEDFKKITLAYLFLQLAVSANLILIIPIVILSFFVFLHQYLNKRVFAVQYIVLSLFHLGLILFWLWFSIFLQSVDALYYGEGNYLQTTFISLVNLLTGTTQTGISFVIITVSLFLILAIIGFHFKKLKSPVLFFSNPSLFFSLILLLTITMFFLMKITLGINYPEDRTGLFFYLFFILILVFAIDLLKPTLLKAIAIPLILLFLVHFAYSFNLKKHSLVNYETIPERFYTRLIEEQKLQTEKITIGGHRMTELLYSYSNYRNKGLLNLADPADAMLFNCDYYIASKANQVHYKEFYEELDEDKDWGFTLLKRKEKIKRKLVISVDSLEKMQGYNEFFEFYSINDTSFKSQNPLLASFDINIDYADKPFRGWLVFAIDSDEGSYYKRVPLNWIKYDWNNSGNTSFQVISGPLPKKINKMVCYLWNNGNQYIGFRLNGLKIYQLEGSGLNHVVPSLN
ncbi:MAG: hypothetical protein M3Q58_16895 [Bacteroidota bacterium]|nr:hypothetical protein [Bacteroidota bacterium]